MPDTCLYGSPDPTSGTLSSAARAFRAKWGVENERGQGTGSEEREAELRPESARSGCSVIICVGFHHGSGYTDGRWN